ncbi:MAG TPA: hypothetical protein VG889_20090 [Rhizomicrobium sp.]|nr:hypothetical protein [Rhizomicrobium sp.]
MTGPTVTTPRGPFTLARGCDGCTLCCKVLAAEPLGKPMNRWCVHCVPGAGCGIHATRPPVCRNYQCGWTIDAALGEEWRPTTAHIVITYDLDGRRLNANADEDFPDAWQREPYYSQLKAWAASAMPRGGQVMAYVGNRAFAILPDRHVELGILAPEDLVYFEVVDGRWNARKVDAVEAERIRAASEQPT